MPLRISFLIPDSLVQMNLMLIQQIDALLPQTQCGLCGHRDGCLPYAQSISLGEDANKCVPGGQPVADALAALLGRDKKTAESSVWPIQSDGRPQRIKAVIREDECIGCTKCISACPVDAIVGSAKLMHSILSDLCTGCELCIPPCPVDCIDLIDDPTPIPTEQFRLDEQQQLRKRYYAHIQREDTRSQHRNGPILRQRIDREIFSQFVQFENTSKDTTTVAAISKGLTQDTIQLVKLRTQIKKLEKQLSVRPNDVKQAQLIELQNELASLEEQ